MKQPLKQFIKSYLLSICIILFFVTEAINKYYLFYEDSTVILAKSFKAIIFIYFLSLLFLKKTEHFNLLLVAILIILFIIAQLTIEPNFDFLVVSNFLKYLFPIIFFLGISSYVNPTSFKVFEGVLITNSLLVFLGFVFNIYLFKTYDGQRFGYNGLLITSATSTYFYIVSIFYLFFKHSKNIYKKRITYLVLIAMLLIGTKSLYITILFSLIFYTCSYLNKKKAFFTISLLVLASFGIFYYIFFGNSFFGNITEEKGFLSSLLSFRNELLINRMLPFIKSNWKLTNYLIGGINSISTRSQMGCFDLVYFFGFLGGVYYFLLYCKCYFLSWPHKGFLIISFFVFFIAFVSGNFFLNASVPVYMVMLRSAYSNYFIKNNNR